MLSSRDHSWMKHKKPTLLLVRNSRRVRSIIKDRKIKVSLRERQRQRRQETALFTAPFSLLFVMQPASDEKM